ncbi:MAG: DUF192 domain-containing protein [Candidatus Aenigmarchaeota archaeon]|nr:DUF192 domain-containing protein [Candidatus Aenigmarchaeota archaeon]
MKTSCASRFLKTKLPFVASILFVSMCTSASFTKVVIGGTEVFVETADSPAEWEKGLMNRASLGENNGMLFVFPDEQQRSFWMKNTLIPLDIIFISSDLTIVDIKRNFQPCRSFFCETYKSKQQAKYVLEVNADFAGIHNIKIGDKAAFS